MNSDFGEINLDIAGLGIVFYSPEHVAHITDGEDYFEHHYSTADQVQRHIQAGSIVGFGVGSPGRYSIRLFKGYPSIAMLNRSEFKLRLGLQVGGGLVCFRDLYSLICWHGECPPDQIAPLENGVYHVTLCSDLPASGRLGDGQVIHFYLNKLDRFPALRTEGIPMLCE